MERMVTEAEGIEGLVLRYGFFYGPGTSIGPGGQQAEDIRRRRFPIVGDGGGRWSLIHVEDAAAATVAALDRGGSGVLNVVDDEPALMREWVPGLARVLGRQAAAPRAGVAGAARRRRRHGRDRHAGPRREQRPGARAARLGAALPELARGLRGRLRRVTGEEHSPELAETDPRRLAELYEDVTPRMRAVLDLLIDRAPERLTFQEVELELGWPRGYFASVFGGFRGRRGKQFKRPFRLGEPRHSPVRAWELWLDPAQARALARRRAPLSRRRARRRSRRRAAPRRRRRGGRPAARRRRP